jgi:hypothetical protein
MVESSFVAECQVFASFEASDCKTDNVVADVTDMSEGTIQIGFSLGRKRVYLTFLASDFRRAVRKKAGE